MSTPTAICLDTEVFDRLNFNFAATTLQEFIKLCKERKLKLLLPAPIQDEIARHMFDRANELDAALSKVEHDALRKCSFLQKWDRFPTPPREKHRHLRLRSLCNSAWEAFARQVNAEELRYEGVKLDAIMYKYNYMQAPFAAGEKRKEFPDAISLAVLDVYARRHGTHVAVVSGDVGMRDGCNDYPSLFAFPSLSSLMETFLAEDQRVDRYVNVINANLDDLNQALSEVIDDYGVFTHYDRQYTRTRGAVHGASVLTFDLIGLGINECTIAFSGEVESEHELTWDDYDYDGRPYKKEGWIKQEFDFGGTAKIKFSAGGEEIASCDKIELEGYDFELSQTPRRW